MAATAAGGAPIGTEETRSAKVSAIETAFGACRHARLGSLRRNLSIVAIAYQTVAAPLGYAARAYEASPLRVTRRAIFVATPAPAGRGPVASASARRSALPVGRRSLGQARERLTISPVSGMGGIHRPP